MKVVLKVADSAAAAMNTVPHGNFFLSIQTAHKRFKKD